MGILADGTLCAYCCINVAFYIPDGCVAPLCFGHYASDLRDPQVGISKNVKDGKASYYYA